MESKYNDSYNPSTPESKLPLILSTLLFGVIGSLVSFITNCTLAEISISAFFSLYFGLFFILIGMIVLYRAHTAMQNQLLIGAFGICILLSGLICFMVEKNWFMGISAHTKIGLYALIGASVTFSISFSIVDLVNYFMPCCNQRAVVEHPM